MRSSGSRFGSLLVALTLALAFTGLGCADEACFQWTTAEGACPAEADALPFFEDPSCPGTGEIESVDSDGVFEDDACCYTVTKRDQSFGAGCFGGAPVGTGVTTVGVTTVSSTSGGGGFSGAGGSSGVGGAGGAGGAGGSASCVRCAEAITVGNSMNLCPSSLELFNQLTDCMCNGVCASSCAPECAGATPTSMVCQQCLTDTMMGCGTQFDLCSNDL